MCDGKYRIEATIESFSIGNGIMFLNLKGTSKYSIESISGVKKEKIMFNLLERIEPSDDIEKIISEKDKVKVEVNTTSCPICKHLLDHIFSERRKMVFKLEKTGNKYTLYEVAHISG